MNSLGVQSKYRVCQLAKKRFSLFEVSFIREIKTVSSYGIYPLGGGVVLPIMAYRGGSARKGYLFQSSGI